MTAIPSIAGRARRAARATGIARPRRGAKRTLSATIRKIPQYLRLLGGLFTDRRVSAIDKVLVGAAIAYVISPFDLIPDVIPFLGQVDDVFLITTALQRLLNNAGRSVLLDHWTGDRAELSSVNIEAIVSAATFFLPLVTRRKLLKVGRRK